MIKTYLAIRDEFPDYYSPKKRCWIAFGASNFMMLVGKKLVWIPGLLQSWSYWLPEMFSFIFALTEIYMIHHTIRILDVLYPWEKKRSKRLGPQLVLAVLLPCWLNKKLVEGLFIAFGQDFEKSGFTRFEIWIIFFGMLLYNFLYKEYYTEWLKNENGYFHALGLPAPVVAQAPITILLSAPTGSASQPQDAFWGKNSLNERRIGFDEIAWIRSQDSKRWLITLQGERFEIEETLDEAIRRLNPGEYYRINRDYIVNCRIMIGFSYCSERNKETGNITYYKELKFGNEQTGVEARRIPKDKERTLRNLIHKNREDKRNNL